MGTILCIWVCVGVSRDRKGVQLYHIHLIHVSIA